MSASQAERRGFNSRLPLHIAIEEIKDRNYTNAKKDMQTKYTDHVD